MSQNSRSRITITLGDSRQVVKRPGPPLDDSFGDSELTAGRKRSVKDRLGGVGDSATGFGNKRLRGDGRGLSQVDSSDGMGLGKDDLRFRIMRKKIGKNSQGNDQVDLRDLLSRPAQSSIASASARPNIPEQSDARQRFPELGNGKQHMSEMREPKQNMAESRNRRHDMAEVNDARPNRSGITGRVPSTSVAGSLSHMSMLRSSSPWTSETPRQRSTGVALRQRSPGVAFRRRSPDVSSRQRSPDVSLRRRSPDVAFGRRSPDEPLRRRSPNVALRRRSPDVALRRRSPDVVLRRRSPDVFLRRRSPDVVLRRKSPDVALRRRSPAVVLRRISPVAALRRPCPNATLRRTSPDMAIRRRSPDMVSSTPRGYSPSRREEELQRGPSARSYNDRGEGTYMSKDVHDLPRPRPSVPCMRTSALPAAHVYMTKDVPEFSRPRPSVPYMTTGLPAVHAKPMIPMPTSAMQPNNLLQRSSYVTDPPTVDSFLRSLGLEKYWISFKAEEVDMYSLRQMGDNDLKDLGIPMGPRKKILLALQARYRRQVT